MEWCFPTTGDQTTLQLYDNLTTYVCLVSCVQVTESITSRQDIYKGRAAEVDMVTLVAAILITLLRRDMSLNRRLFTWLLGTEINPSSFYPDCHTLASKEGFYFNYSSDLLIKALHHSSAALTAVDPADTCGRKQELIKTANLMFNQLETSYVWVVCGDQFRAASARAADTDSGDMVGGVGAGPPSLSQICNIIGTSFNDVLISRA